MRRLLIALALVCCLPSLAYAQQTMIANGTSLTDWQIVGDCQMTSVSSATSPSSCSGGIPAGTVWAIITVESNAARWTGKSGNTPTTTFGQLLPASSSTTVYQLTWVANTLANLLLIPVASTMTINVTFVGR